MSIKKSQQQDNLNSEDLSQTQGDSGQESSPEGDASVAGALNEAGTGTIRVNG